MVNKANQSNAIVRNPFTPEFGKVPAYLAGRDRLIAQMIDALDSDGNSPDLCMLLVGARGTGKTALLTYLGNEAEQMGWIKAEVTAGSEMLEDILQQAIARSEHLVDAKGEKQLKSISIAGVGGVEWENPAASSPTWRTRMNTLLDLLAESNVGLLITVDEADPSLDEMTQLVTTYQHFVRENRKVGLLMAGLPYNVDSLLSGKTTSFLRRASRFDLGSLSDAEVEEAFRLTVEEGGRAIESAALQEAVAAIRGFPFLFQLVGFRSWNVDRSSAVLEKDDVVQGARIANEEMGQRIFDSTYRELSKADRAFLMAMLPDDGPTTRENLMDRLEKPSGHISTYKKRLVRAGLIDETPSGALTFSLPGFREYLENIE